MPLQARLTVHATCRLTPVTCSKVNVCYVRSYKQPPSPQEADYWWTLGAPACGHALLLQLRMWACTVAAPAWGQLHWPTLQLPTFDHRVLTVAITAEEHPHAGMLAF